MSVLPSFHPLLVVHTHTPHPTAAYILPLLLGTKYQALSTEDFLEWLEGIKFTPLFTHLHLPAHAPRTQKQGHHGKIQLCSRTYLIHRDYVPRALYLFGVVQQPHGGQQGAAGQGLCSPSVSTQTPKLSKQVFLSTLQGM